jgi:hypothetical protein
MVETITLYYAYRTDGRVREPLHADPDCHHLQRSEGTVRPVCVAVPVSRDVCGTCGGDVPVVEPAASDETADTGEESPADAN